MKQEISVHDILNDIDQRLDFLQLSLTYIINEYVSDKTACGVGHSFEDISAQIQKAKAALDAPGKPAYKIVITH